jgi:hypothetical protein
VTKTHRQRIWFSASGHFTREREQRVIIRDFTNLALSLRATVAETENSDIGIEVWGLREQQMNPDYVLAIITAFSNH